MVTHLWLWCIGPSDMGKCVFDCTYSHTQADLFWMCITHLCIDQARLHAAALPNIPD